MEPDVSPKKQMMDRLARELRVWRERPFLTLTQGNVMYIGGGILGTILVILAIIYLAKRI